MIILNPNHNENADHDTRNYGIIVAFFLFFLATYVIGTGFVTGKQSKGEILVFKRCHLPTSIKTQLDEENGTAVIGTNIAAAITPSGDLGEIAIQKQTAVFHWKDVCYDMKIKASRDDCSIMWTAGSSQVH
jgi:hypothetical protein